MSDVDGTVVDAMYVVEGWRAKPSTGSVSIVPPLTARKRPNFHEMGLADPLDDELGDPVTCRNGEPLLGIRVEQVDQDLAAVARIHCAGRIQHRDAVPGSQPRARVNEGGIPGGQGDRNTGRNQGALPRSEEHVLSGIQVRSGVTRVRVRG